MSHYRQMYGLLAQLTKMVTTDGQPVAVTIAKYQTVITVWVNVDGDCLYMGQSLEDGSQMITFNPESLCAVWARQLD